MGAMPSIEYLIGIGVAGIVVVGAGVLAVCCVFRWGKQRKKSSSDTGSWAEEGRGKNRHSDGRNQEDREKQPSVEKEENPGDGEVGGPKASVLIEEIQLNAIFAKQKQKHSEAGLGTVAESSKEQEEKDFEEAGERLDRTLVDQLTTEEAVVGSDSLFVDDVVGRVSRVGSITGINAAAGSTVDSDSAGNKVDRDAAGNPVDRDVADDTAVKSSINMFDSDTIAIHAVDSVAADIHFSPHSAATEDLAAALGGLSISGSSSSSDDDLDTEEESSDNRRRFSSHVHDNGTMSTPADLFSYGAAERVTESFSSGGARRFSQGEGDIGASSSNDGGSMLNPAELRRIEEEIRFAFCSDSDFSRSSIERASAACNRDESCCSTGSIGGERCQVHFDVGSLLEDSESELEAGNESGGFEKAGIAGSHKSPVEENADSSKDSDTELEIVQVGELLEDRETTPGDICQASWEMVDEVQMQVADVEAEVETEDIIFIQDDSQMDETDVDTAIIGEIKENGECSHKIGAIGGDDSTTADCDDSAIGGGEDSATVSGDDSATGGGDDSAAGGGDDSAIGGGNDSAAGGGDDSAIGGGNDSTTGGGDDSAPVSGDDSARVNVDDSARVGVDDSSPVSGDDSAAASGDDSATGDFDKLADSEMEENPPPSDKLCEEIMTQLISEIDNNKP